MPKEILQSAIKYIGARYGATLAHHILTLALRRVRESERTAKLATAGVCVLMQAVKPCA
jgi:hypothetical protein